MAKLIQNKDPFLYSLDNLLEDDDWGYVFSYSFQAPENDEDDEDRGFPQMKKERRQAFSHASVGPQEGPSNFHG